MTRVILALLSVYRYFISPLLGPHCRFLPTCSEFCREAIVRHGPWHGSWLTLRRIGRCNPWHCGGHDPVP